MGVTIRSDVWFGYADEAGTGFAEIDHLIFHRRGIIIVECKLTQTPNAEAQIKELYRPLVQMVFPGVLVQGVQICKNIWHEPALPVNSLREVVASGSEDIHTWHHLG